MTAPHLSMIFADNGIPYNGRCRKAIPHHLDISMEGMSHSYTEYHGSNSKSYFISPVQVGENPW
jgi:hypothetical protein